MGEPSPGAAGQGLIGQWRCNGLCQPLGWYETCDSHTEGFQFFLQWADRNVMAFSFTHLPGVENCQADYPSRQTLNQGEWSLHPDVFHQLCPHWELWTLIFWCPTLPGRCRSCGINADPPGGCTKCTGGIVGLFLVPFTPSSSCTAS